MIVPDTSARNADVALFLPNDNKQMLADIIC